MDPIFLILYAVVVTLALTLLYPRLSKANPRLLLGLVIAGIMAFLAVLVLAFVS